MTKQLLIAAGAVIAAFTVALGGAYYAMPMAAPGVVAHADSLAAASDSSTAPIPQAPDSTLPAEVAALVDTARPDSTDVADSSARPTGTALTDASATPAAVQPLRDSLQSVRSRLSAAREAAAAHQEEAELLRRELSASQAGRLQVDELGKALLNMDERELKALLEKVDMDALKRLYGGASGRARTRLLKAMDPTRAARFVNEVVEATNTSVASSSSYPSSSSR